ncbi:MAG: response regulator [Gammaproteobacteria bacterium SHHR-1]|uniref:response regulator n=1 Tax=Magnetovirga frankeli TaxID=947516 RepID=UPI00129358DA|nr:response regulator [gamma proteobacterium SS-5]
MARILIADDDLLILTLLQEILDDAGHEAISVSTGLEVEKILAQQPVDLLLTDIFMPDREGIETIMLTRKAYPDLPILAMSSNSDYLRMANKLGADAILAKPVNEDELLQLLDRLLKP